jgi:exosortase
MVGVLFGLVLYLGGPRVMRVAWLPILFLIFALPIPELLYARFSLPLQNIAAKGAVVIVQLLGVDISSNASSLHLSSQSGVPRDLTVAEACSGMRLLMAFLALGVATAYLDYKPLWQRVILVGAAIPIAVFCNTLRVSITCWMYYIDKAELGQDFMHYFTGVLMLIPALGMLWVLSWLLKLTLVDVEEDEETPAPPAGQGGAS